LTIDSKINGENRRKINKNYEKFVQNVSFKAKSYEERAKNEIRISQNVNIFIILNIFNF